MIGPDTITAGIRLVRAQEAWEPVIFGGMIPVLGAGAVFALIRYAVKEPPEEAQADQVREPADQPDQERRTGEPEDPDQPAP